METTKPKIVAVIPCYNTEAHVGEVVTKARKYVDEVIIVDDGSTDDTVNEATYAGAKVVGHDQNRGYGGAIRTCIREARRNDVDILVIIDGDGQHNADEIPLFIEPILKKEADLVIGSRFIKHEHNMPGYREFGIKVITWLWNVFSKVRVTDAQSGFRSYSKPLMQDLVLYEDKMDISIEILEEARRLGAVIKEVPISCHYTHSRISINAFKHGIPVALSAIRLRLKRHLIS
jgi:glycosyltransferase involved in cell wall biosynthesis